MVIKKYITQVILLWRRCWLSCSHKTTSGEHIQCIVCHLSTRPCQE